MRLQLSVTLLFCAASAAGNAVPTIEESLGMKSVAGGQISPDGRYVAYTVQHANWDENDFYTQIWIAIPVTGERVVVLHPLVAAKISVYQAMRGRQTTPEDLARRLGWEESRVRRVLDLRRRSRLEDIEASLAALGKRLVIEVKNAA